MLKVGFLSAWHVHAEGYASEVCERNDAKITAVWDEVPERGREFAKKFGATFYEDYNQLLSSDEVDAVVINSPTNMHKELIIAAAKLKKHVFTEKVLSTTNKEAEEIKEAVLNSGIKFCISFPHRTMPRNLFAKKVIDDKIIGDVTLMRIRNAHNGSCANWLPAHFYNAEQCGGGAMIDLGAHGMYLTYWLLGKPLEISSTFTYVSDRGVEDNAVSVMKYSNGTIVIAETGFVSTESPFSLELYGTQGTLLVGGHDDKVRIISTKQDSELNGWVVPNRLPQKLPDAISQWVDAILHEGEIIFDINSAMELTELMDAAYRSHNEHKPATV